ncbi:MAG: hypothetical protein KKF21_19805 [Bacteroidetes bacterium]|nr:hypothetical protein [Bacteroidota bacterium]
MSRGRVKEKEPIAAVSEPDTLSSPYITPEELLELIEDERADAAAVAAKITEDRVRAEYEAAPLYRGLFGILARIVGLMPDSRGKPSSSWTVYLLAHIPVAILALAISFALIFNSVSLKALAGIPVTIFLVPVALAWIAWLAHHEKLARVVVSIIESVAKGVAAVKSGASSSVLNQITATVASTSVEIADTKLVPGKKIKISRRAADAKPKSDPSTLPDTPMMSS